LSVVSGGGGVNTNPTNIVYSLSGGGTNLTLSWPSDHTGWTLQSSTNLSSSNNWVNVAGSTTTNSVDVGISSAFKALFYRLVYFP
jgi:hypothetical protein